MTATTTRTSPNGRTRARPAPNEWRPSAGSARRRQSPMDCARRVPRRRVRVDVRRRIAACERDDESARAHQIGQRGTRPALERSPRSRDLGRSRSLVGARDVRGECRWPSSGGPARRRRATHTERARRTEVAESRRGSSRPRAQTRAVPTRAFRGRPCARRRYERGFAELIECERPRCYRACGRRRSQRRGRELERRVRGRVAAGRRTGMRTRSRCWRARATRASSFFRRRSRDGRCRARVGAFVRGHDDDRRARCSLGWRWNAASSSNSIPRAAPLQRSSG